MGREVLREVFGSPHWTHLELLRHKDESARTERTCLLTRACKRKRRAHPGWAPRLDTSTTQRFGSQLAGTTTSGLRVTREQFGRALARNGDYAFGGITSSLAMIRPLAIGSGLFRSQYRPAADRAPGMFREQVVGVTVARFGSGQASGLECLGDYPNGG